MLASQRDHGCTFDLLDCHNSWLGQGILQYRGMKTMLEATASPAQSKPHTTACCDGQVPGSRHRRQPPASLSQVFAASYSSGSNTRYSPGEIQPKALIAWRIQSLR